MSRTRSGVCAVPDLHLQNREAGGGGLQLPHFTGDQNTPTEPVAGPPSVRLHPRRQEGTRRTVNRSLNEERPAFSAAGIRAVLSTSINCSGLCWDDPGCTDCFGGSLACLVRLRGLFAVRGAHQNRWYPPCRTSTRTPGVTAGIPLSRHIRRWLRSPLSAVESRFSRDQISAS